MIQLISQLIFNHLIRTATVDGALKHFNKAITQLDKANAVHSAKADKAKAKSDALLVTASAALDEAARAARLAKNLADLIK